MQVRNSAWHWIRRYRVAISLMLLAMLVGAPLYAYRQYERYKRFAEHDAGKMYRSSWLEPDVFAEKIEQYQIKTVVNLCDGGEKPRGHIEDQRAAVEAAGAKLVEIAFPSNRTWGVNYPAFEDLEALLDNPENYPVWVHCWHGRERTVKALSIYDIRKRRMTAEDSLAAMPLWGREHPWPIVVFAYNYETHERCEKPSADHRTAKANGDKSDEPLQR